MASEAIVSCRLLLWRDSLSKMSVNDHDCEMLYDDDADDDTFIVWRISAI